MARSPKLEKLTVAELVAMKAKIEDLIIIKKAEEKADLKAKLEEIAAKNGYALNEILGKGKARGKVAVKYRDPSNSDNTWSGRGRTPLWLVEATKKRGVKKEDFLI